MAAPSPTLGRFPVLTALGLTRDELAALARQGTLHSERGRGGSYNKLRYRIAGKQQVRYVCRALVAGVREELALLQRRANGDRQQRRSIRAANRCLRRAKTRLQPFLPDRGWRFHGHQLRRDSQGTRAPPGASRSPPRHPSTSCLPSEKKIMDEQHVTAAAEPAAIPANRQELSAQQEDELYRAALMEPDPFRAALKASSAELLEVVSVLKRVVIDALGPAPDLRTCQPVLPVIDKLGLLHRQATRYWQLEQSSGAAGGPRGGRFPRQPALPRREETTT